MSHINAKVIGVIGGLYDRKIPYSHGEIENIKIETGHGANVARLTSDNKYIHIIRENMEPIEKINDETDKVEVNVDCEQEEYIIEEVKDTSESKIKNDCLRLLGFGVDRVKLVKKKRGKNIPCIMMSGKVHDTDMLGRFGCIGIDEKGHIVTGKQIGRAHV